jgi:RRXRR protein
LAVFVLAERKQPPMPCSEKRARLLVTGGRAVVHRRHPVTIRLKDHLGGDVGPVRLKIDRGRKPTGIALIADADGNADAISAKYCTLDRADGYGYPWRPALPVPAEAGGLQRGRVG